MFLLLTALIGLVCGFTVPEIGKARRPTLQRSPHALIPKSRTVPTPLTRGGPERRRTAIVVSVMTMPSPEQVWTISLAVVAFLAALATVSYGFVQLVRFALKDQFDTVNKKIDDLNRTLSTRIDEVNKRLTTTNNCMIAGFSYLNVSWTKVGFWRTKDGDIVELDLGHGSPSNTAST